MRLLLTAMLTLSLTACASMKDKTTPPAGQLSKACAPQGFVVFFKTASSRLDPAAIVELDRIGAEYRTCNIYQLEVQGFADSVGNSQSNQKLSDARAEAVFEAMTARGVSANRARIVPMGETTTWDSGMPDAFERRVVIHLIP